ncbi:DNA gyrase/topoisomerase IV subunit A [Stratiformator vulcanicus]|uniref:DNA topoisomerase (ATP-hydrolyzing) n=1 Tax=Stratiformator vulcanicus TaxID=2527980 RepID=A0A517R6U0_9PLAN|nr:DNA topoisomerase (ATP-hydrolyzing) [Stratiformator vulcanicus]QDT39616.1 DNA gyrase subunit A [Stratiformator vulcanicus]
MASKNGRKSKSRTKPIPTGEIRYVNLSEETRRRYLNYALSVIGSRALPDVRDGLKPVQRRILFVMQNDLRLAAGTKPAKCARITGDVTGKYHPHGYEAVYEALVRMAQDFTLREPLVDGQGNFGSVLGLPQAAQRYTEARLSKIAEQLMEELKYQTVEMKPTYDADHHEPEVLPARFPNLLVNGSSGIAVGMATNIPPHNLGEVIRSSIHLIDNPDATIAQLMQKGIKGPDFPLGGRIVTDRKEIRLAYEEGRGTIKVRGEWEFDKEGRKEVRTRIVVNSVPYGVSTGPLVNDLSVIAEARKLPQLLTATDETDNRHGLRIVLSIKSPEDAEAVMAYVYKHTALEQNFSLNMTALVPDDEGTLVPERLGLDRLLRHFLDFRLEVVTKRFEYQLALLERRIHILEGFEIIFDGLDRALKIIRGSDGKEDACQKLMNAFDQLDREQTMAILELQLYRISKLEIDDIRGELDRKRSEADKIRKILESQKKLWGVIKQELNEVADSFGSRRRTGLGSEEEIEEYDPSAYIVRENTNVVLTRDGWVKRVGNLKSVETTRVREGDSVLAVCPASTVDNIVFFANDGGAYTLPVEQIPASSGYGEPLGKHIKLADGVSLVHAVTTDERFTFADYPIPDLPTPGPHLFVTTAAGQVMRLSLNLFREPSTKSGRRYCRLATGDRVVFVAICDDVETVMLASKKARIVHFRMNDVPVLSAAGKGVRGLNLEGKDELLGATLFRRPGDTLKVINVNDKPLSFGQQKYNVTSRGGKGIKTSTRTGFKAIVNEPIELVDWSEWD